MITQKLVIASILIVAAIIATSFTIPNIQTQFDIAKTNTDTSYVYTPSDITKANPNLVMEQGAFSMVENIEHAKDTVVLTLSGTVLSVEDLVDWEYKGNKYGSVPITIEVDKNTKINTETKHQIQKEDSFTFYLSGIYEMDQHFIDNFEPQFEIGEKVIVHIGKSDQGPNGPDGTNYFVELGKYGKYKVVGDKAYNEKYPNGKSLDKAFNEAK